MGGIPHDLYGMTTRSVHQYVLGIYRKFGLKESKITKFQTGGPDGDLGSNEIKISKDRTVCMYTINLLKLSWLNMLQTILCEY